ncbi:hypothetical protein BV25DRAFT_1859661 [Artomyces pyxidatus]|uniref:Uncharacterized protein n=1 Tax=Artomyces pyxidatus TaxID=48021 RepID=A0ACB8SVQ1_9AGAM|nr:hypothetical protein BV25DRAFT_1859661 [Artomyces pyxidatus]
MQASSSSLERKRPRLDFQQDALVNHPTLYFDDGNVILRCQKTLFRVHRSIVSKHSPVLRELVSVERARETMRGHALVVLDDDREDMEALLQTIYDGMRVDFPSITAINFPLVSSLLRMSAKYRVPRLHDDLVARLRTAWPPTLPEHLAQWARAQAELLKPGREDLIVHPAAVIALLRASACADTALLAALFYDLSRRVWQLGPPFTGHHLGPLAHADVERLVFGVARLRAEQAAVAAVRPATPHPACATAVGALWDGPGRALVNAANQMAQPVEDLDVFRLAAAAYLRQHGCAACSEAVGRYLGELQQKMWDGMPAAFGLV